VPDQGLYGARRDRHQGLPRVPRRAQRAVGHARGEEGREGTPQESAAVVQPARADRTNAAGRRQRDLRHARAGSVLHRDGAGEGTTACSSSAGAAAQYGRSYLHAAPAPAQADISGHAIPGAASGVHFCPRQQPPCQTRVRLGRPGHIGGRVHAPPEKPKIPRPKAGGLQPASRRPRRRHEEIYPDAHHR